MNVLFACSPDIKAYYLAKQLIREGHDILWVTDEKSGELLDSSSSVKTYRSGFNSMQLNRILTLHSVELVVFGYSLNNEAVFEGLVPSQIPALQNTLRAVSDYGRARFLYLSTEELSYDQVLTSELAEYQYGEALCMSYADNEGLEVLIVRSDIVYGEYAARYGSWIDHAVKSVKAGVSPVSRRSGSTYFDLLYGEDFGLAVQDLIILEKTGVYDVVTGHPLSSAELQYLLSDIAGTRVEISWLNKVSAPGPEEQWKSSIKLKEDTGWIPNFLPLERGRGILQQIFDRPAPVSSESDSDETESGAKKEKPPFYKRPLFKEFAETVILFVIISAALPFVRDSADFRYLDLRLLFVVLSALAFGMRMGIFATVLACVSYAASLKREGIDLTFLLYSVATWIPFIIYGIAGAVVGYISDHKSDEVAEANNKYEIINERYAFLKELHKDALEVKSRLQQQITTSHESFGKIYEIAEQLDSLQSERILFQTIRVISDVMGGCYTAVWTVNPERSSYARRHVCSAELSGVLPNSLNLKDYPLIMEGFNRENSFINSGLHENYPDFAAPVYNQGKIVAFVAIYSLDPERYTQYYRNLFKMLTGLIENSLVRALTFEEMRRSEIYVDGTCIMNAEEFKSRLDEIREQQEEYNQSSLQLILDSPYDSLQEISEKIRTSIRDNDFAGFDKNGAISIVLLNATVNDFGIIQKRFAGKGMEVSVWHS